MGLLLTFMFLWNMIGALILIPALSHFMLGNVHADVEEPAGEPVPSPINAVECHAVQLPE